MINHNMNFQTFFEEVRNLIHGLDSTHIFEHKAKINNMLVSGNMNPQKWVGTIGSKKCYFKKKFLTLASFYFMTVVCFPTAFQLTKTEVWKPNGHTFFYISFLVMMFY